MTTCPITDTEIMQELARVQSLRAMLILHHPFFATLLLPMRIVSSLALPTFAATNGYDTVWFSPPWSRALSLKQLGYVLLHEVGHVGLLHALRQGPRDHTVWNCASDIATNTMLDAVRGADGKPLYDRPEHVDVPGLGTCSVLTADWAKDLSSEEIYERLVREAQDVPAGGNGASRQGGSTDGPGMSSPNAGRTEAPQRPGDRKHAGNGSGEPDWSQIPCRPGETCAQAPTPLTDDQAERLTDRVIAAHEAWVASRQQGTMPAGLLRLLQHLRAAKVPWQRVLHQYAGQALAKEDFSLFPPHKRWLSEYDIVRPSCRSERLGHLVVTVDTSGSISQAALKAFASEIARLHTLSEDTLILTCDAAVHDVIRTHEAPRFLATLTFKGGGGTSHVPVFTWLAEHRVLPDLLVALTDLYTTYPDSKPSYPILWCAPENHGDPPPWGRVG